MSNRSLTQNFFKPRKYFWKENIIDVFIFSNEPNKEAYLTQSNVDIEDTEYLHTTSFTKKVKLPSSLQESTSENPERTKTKLTLTKKIRKKPFKKKTKKQEKILIKKATKKMKKTKKVSYVFF